MAEFIIHRGTHQIGGMCAEVRTKTSRVIIDMGTNLPGNKNNCIISGSELVESLFNNDEEKKTDNAIIFTHYHGDHIGLFDDILSEKYNNINLDKHQIYMGQTAKQIKSTLFNAIESMGYKEENEKVKKIDTFNNGENFSVGNILITPILVNHSAIDSYMFLITADNKTILYTGDFRNHGHFLSGEELYKKIKDTLKEQKIDYLVTEGTMFSRKDAMSNKKIFSETQLEEKAVSCFKESMYNFVLVSSTNFDSILSFYRAAEKTKRHFLCDKYQQEQIKTAAEFYNNVGINSFSSEKIKSFDFWKHKIDFSEHINSGFVMLVRAKDDFINTINNFSEAFPDKKYNLIYSMWNGYLQKDSENSEEYSRHDDYSQSIYTFINEFECGNNKVKILKDGYHTSGHASKECIEELINQLKPNYVIPMHSECSDDIKEKLNSDDANYFILNDGDILNLEDTSVKENIYSFIYRIPNDKTDITEQYQHIAEQVISILNDNSENDTYKGWVSRFNEYYSNAKFDEKNDFLEKYPIISTIPEDIQVYSPVGAGKKTIQLRKDGALIAHLTHQGEKRGWEVYPEDSAAKFKISEESDESLLYFINKQRKSNVRGGSEWDNIKDILKSIVPDEEKKLIEEHKFESIIHSKIESNDDNPKSQNFCNLKPVFLVDKCRFQMPVPFNANQIAKNNIFKYLKKSKGNIDILAKTTDGVLTVIELKDSYCESEKPSESIKQAIIYAAFMAKLINTEKSGDWKNLFGNDIKTNEINAVICMPYSEKMTDEDFSFAGKEIKIADGTIHLHYIYLDNDNNIFKDSFSL